MIALIDPETNEVLCPECGYNYSHIHQVFTRIGSDPFEGGAPYSGTQAIGCVASRRSCLVIVFEGECGHRFEWQIQQHKGNNYATAHFVGEAMRHA